MIEKTTKVFIILISCCLYLALPGRVQASVIAGSAKSTAKDSISQAPKEVLYDRGEVLTRRRLDKELNKELLTDKELNYLREVPAELSWKQWLIYKLRQLFSKHIVIGGNIGTLLTYCLYIFAGATVIYIILRLLGIRPTGLLFKNKQIAMVYDTGLEEDIHAINFEQQMEEAVRQADYRKATRLLYLAALKLLSDKQQIKWQPGKTNHEYLAEVTVQELKSGIGELAHYFEYAWYGSFPLSESTFSHVRFTFKSLEEKLQKM
jgi:hypothetical protein